MSTKKCTIFCDIDGTLFQYRKFENYKSTMPMIVMNVRNSINNAYDEGHCVLLTTARPEYLRGHTMKELDEENIKYSRLIMGIERGLRILINDNEVDMDDRAFAFNIARNKGFTPEQLNKFNEITSNKCLL